MSAGFQPRVALVSTRFTLFDREMPADFPERMRAHARRSAEILSGFAEVIEPPLIEDEAGARAVRARLQEESPDAVVFAPAMAAPPSFAATAIGTVAPVVIWNAPTLETIPTDLTQADATEHTTTVGCIMFGNVLVRRGVEPIVVTAPHHDRSALDGLRRVVMAAAAAGSLREATFLRVGDPIPGYLDVAVSPEDLHRLGVHETAVDRPDWEDRVQQVSTAAADALMADLRRSGWGGDPGPQVGQSARIAVALSELCDERGAIGAAINCHGPYFRESPAVGLPGCLAAACLTGRGRPVACTGDLPTSITLALARRLAGAALYCETYAIEPSSGLVLLAAGGEGDPAWAAPGDAPRLEANEHYPGRRGTGTGVAFRLRTGPATLLSLSPGASGWHLAWATGEIVETRSSRMGGPNGMLRFDRQPATDALSHWIASGATHHHALAPGRLDVEVPVIARALGIHHQRV